MTKPKRGGARANSGGRRPGAGRKSVSAQVAFERALASEVVRGGRIEEAALDLVKRVGMSPRRRLLLGEDVRERTDGPWLRRLIGLTCRQTIGRWNGMPLEFYPGQAGFIDDVLEFDDDGNRVFGTGVFGVARKNGKTTMCGGLAIGLASPAEGEGRPSVVLGAGSREQATPLLEQTIDFARGDELLRSVFVASKSAIECPANGGRIWAVAGDGKLNHGLNPYVVIPDELHAWLTPRQRENWAALTTADGARDDALVLPITTAGYDTTSVLAELLSQARQSPFFEARPEMGGGGFVVRDPDARLLVHWYAVAPGTPFEDLDEWKRANPAPWRTKDRIHRDLAKRTIDEGTKRRLYGNEWTSAKDVWIRRDDWRARLDAEAVAEAFVPDRRVGLGVDASLNHDTTAVGLAARLDDGRIAVRAHVFSVRTEVAAHEYLAGPMIRLADVEDHVRELDGSFEVGSLGFDPRYFVRSAEMLDEDGMTVVKYEPNGRETWEAVQSFYNLVMQGGIVHDGDPVLAAHVDACAGLKTDRGWKLSKLGTGRTALPIDAVLAVIFAVDRVVNDEPDVYVGMVEIPG